MSLQIKIETKLSEALKAKDKKTYSTLRLVVAAIKDTMIAKKNLKDKKTLPDNDLIGLLKKMVKQRNDSCDAYKKAGRNELLENEMSEIKIINEFLPKQLSEEETKKICFETMKKIGASSVKDMGKVMGTLKKEYSDVLDFLKVSQIIKENLK
ncbi:MAG: aspartyl-tRNA amidotransferase subunit B [Candidatus Pelagibacterales bacterium]|nr:MAG: aspartyl-tRNA amidotransferase subunit B [Pelagibacterales bacterium]